MLKHIGVLLIIMISVNTWADIAPYKGVGGQIEAYGAIMATYFSAQKAAETCGKYPALKAESDTATKGYISANRPLFERMTQRLGQLAQMNGGEVESRRLKAEIDAALPYLDKDATKEVNEIATSVVACNNILSNLKKNLWDLQVRHPNEIMAILGSENQVGTLSFIKGIIEGCIDGQKRQLVKQGLSYQGNEETIRQYCHCMAPLTVDIASTADGRSKLMDGDQKIKVRLQKLETICLDGINNARRFAPEK